MDILKYHKLQFSIQRKTFLPYQITKHALTYMVNILFYTYISFKHHVFSHVSLDKIPLPLKTAILSINILFIYLLREKTKAILMLYLFTSLLHYKYTVCLLHMVYTFILTTNKLWVNKHPPFTLRVKSLPFSVPYLQTKITTATVNGFEVYI